MPADIAALEAEVYRVDPRDKEFDIVYRTAAGDFMRASRRFCEAKGEPWISGQWTTRANRAGMRAVANAQAAKAWQHMKIGNQRAIDAEEKVSRQARWIDEARLERAAFGEEKDQAFLDGYGAAYMASKRTMAGYPGFVPMAEYMDDAKAALAEWRKDIVGGGGDEWSETSGEAPEAAVPEVER
jgi:hypothetical protein